MKRLILVFFLIVILCFLPIFNKFTITDGHTNEVVFFNDIKKMRDFDVTFTHSVNKTPVKEFYKIIDGKFNLYKGEFSSYGAGMSDGSDLKNTEIYYGENGEIFLDMDVDFEIITYYVGTVADHRLSFGKNIIHLNDMIRPKSPAILAIKKTSILQIIKYKYM